jgi:hypothetical protein
MLPFLEKLLIFSFVKPSFFAIRFKVAASAYLIVHHLLVEKTGCWDH